MANIVVRSGKISALINAVSRHFQSKVIDDLVEMRINIPASSGDGFLVGSDLHGGLSICFINVRLKEPLTIIDRMPDKPLRFLYSLEGEVQHANNDDETAIRLTPLTGSVVASTSGSEDAFTIPANSNTCCFCIHVDRKQYHDKIHRCITNLTPPELKDLLDDVAASMPFHYQRHISLGIAQCLQNIRLNAYRDFVKRVYIESKVLEIISMHIQQYIDDKLPVKKTSLLRQRDMDLMVTAKEMLLSDLVNPPTIRQLAQRTGTNENKLKAGFRMLFNTTINKMLQDERLARAKVLMAEEKHTIREIAKMVGYRHPAHFSSKFRKRFGILPKEYLRSMR